MINQVNFAEAHLTTGRFEEAVRRIAVLLAQKDLDDHSRIGLSSLEIVGLSASDSTRDLPARLKSLRETLAAQPADFELQWSFAGVKVFIAKDARMAAQRAWLLELIAALETRERQAALVALDAISSRRFPDAL